MPKDANALVLCIYNLTKCIAKIDEFRNTFFRWTNIPQNDFTPPAEILKEELLASYTGPLLRDPFFIKFPWVLHDILVLFKGIIY